MDGRALGARHRYTAGTAAQRAADLHWALTDPGLHGLWFARGGYGTVHALPELPWDRLDGRPIIGFSDATALFSAMYARGLSGGLHGPVLHSLADLCDAPTAVATHDALAGLPVHLPFAGPAQVVEGPLVGGNLAVLASVAGTPWASSAAGAIALVEDIGEPAYRLDRIVTQLIQSGYFDGCLAVVLGELIACRAPEGADYSVQDVVVQCLADAGLTVFTGAPVGHGAQNRPWWYGRSARLGSDGLHQDAGLPMTARLA